MLSSDEYSFRYDAGVTVPSTSVKLADTEEIVLAIAKHFLVYTCKGELDQLKKGLEHLNVLDLLLRHRTLVRPLFVAAGKEKLTSSRMLTLFRVDWSPHGSNQREVEEAVILGWTEYVNELESKMIAVAQNDGA